MTCARKRVEAYMRGEADATFAQAAFDLLDRGDFSCCITQKNGKLHCGHIPKGLPYGQFCHACKVCRTEIRDMLLRETSIVVGIFHEEAPKVLLQLKAQRDP